MYNQKENNLEGVLASLSPECVDQLCSIIIAKLTGMNPRALASQASCRGFESHHPLATPDTTTCFTATGERNATTCPIPP